MFDDSFKKFYENVPVAVWTYKDTTFLTEIHNHAEIEIALKIKGQSESTICNKKFISSPGDILFKNPFEVHSSTPITDTGSGCCICFDCSLIADESIAEMLKSEKMRIANIIPACDENNAEIQRLFMNIVDCFEKKGQYMLLEIKTHISMLIVFLLNNGYIKIIESPEKDEIFYKKVFQFISHNYTQNITSKDVSDELSYNHSYFCRKFRKCFDRQFNDYLNMFRVFESQRLFMENDKTITQIAVECGFNSQIYFTKCFKKYIGILPSEYRKKANGDI